VAILERLVRLLVPYETVECPVCEQPIDVVPEVIPGADGTWWVPRPDGELERQCAAQHGSRHPVGH
jgi:hypothetical protein